MIVLGERFAWAKLGQVGDWTPECIYSDETLKMKKWFHASRLSSTRCFPAVAFAEDVSSSEFAPFFVRLAKFAIRNNRFSNDDPSCRQARNVFGVFETDNRARERPRHDGNFPRLTSMQFGETERIQNRPTSHPLPLLLS